MYVTYSRGNRNLVKRGTNENIGQNVVWAGPAISKINKTNLMYKSYERPWSDDFHTFSIEWRPG